MALKNVLKLNLVLMLEEQSSYTAASSYIIK
jgi:hypothetical protein